MKRLFRSFSFSFIFLTIFSFIFILLATDRANAASPSLTTVTITLTDSNGQVWSNATWRTEFVPPFGNPYPPSNNGNPVKQPQTGQADGTGTFTVVLDDNKVVTPSLSTTRFTICPNATTTVCTTTQQVVTGTTQNLSATITPILLIPTVNAQPTIYRAYSDAEVSGGLGALYVRVSDSHIRICNQSLCNGSGWSDTGLNGAILSNPLVTQYINQPYGTDFIPNIINGVVQGATLFYNWSQSINTTLTAGVQATVTLTPCPPGVDTTSGVYGVRVSTGGTPSATRVTGGTCTSGATTGTIIFTPLNSYTSPFVIGSASTGRQEMINAAGPINTAVSLRPTGVNTSAIPIYYPVSIRATNFTLTANGETWACYFERASCLTLGNRTNANAFININVIGLKMYTMVNSTGCTINNYQRTSNVVTITTDGTCPFIVGSNDSYIHQKDTPNQSIDGIKLITSVPDSTHYTYAETGVDIVSTPTWGSAIYVNNAIEDSIQGMNVDNFVVFNNSDVGSGRFSDVFVIRNDQTAEVHNPEIALTALKADTQWVGDAFFLNGSNDAGLLNISGRCNISLAGHGNGIDSLSGNSGSEDHCIIQGVSEFQIRSTVRFGNSQQNYTGSDAYPETGTGFNPNAMGVAGWILAGGTTSYQGIPPAGVIQTWTGSIAGTSYYTYIVPHFAGGIGNIQATGKYTTDGTAVPNIGWYRLGSSAEGPITYDLLASSNTTVAPNGTGNYLIASGITEASACGSNGICHYSYDTSVALTSYTVPGITYFPRIVRGVGDWVLSTNTPTNNPGLQSQSMMVKTNWIGSSGGLVNNILGSIAPSMTADRCNLGTMVPTNIIIKCPNSAGGDGFSNNGSALLVNSWGIQNGGTADKSGPYNFSIPVVGYSSPPIYIRGDLFTFAMKHNETLYTTNNFRATSDPADTAFGIDCTTSCTSDNLQLGYRHPTNGTFSLYWNSTFDNSSWKFRWNNNGSISKEGTAPTGVAGQDICNGDSTKHGINCIFNNDFNGVLSRIVGKAQITVAAVTTASGACSNGSATVTGVNSTDTVDWSFASAPGGAGAGWGGSVTGAVVQLYVYPTTNTVNYQICNNTAASITNGALVINTTVRR